jgi:hypothetical protein
MRSDLIRLEMTWDTDTKGPAVLAAKHVACMPYGLAGFEVCRPCDYLYCYLHQPNFTPR